jgi:hypothetical protein
MGARGVEGCSIELYRTFAPDYVQAQLQVRSSPFASGSELEICANFGFFSLMGGF